MFVTISPLFFSFSITSTASVDCLHCDFLQISSDTIRYLFSMANNFNSDFNSTIPEQRSLFFLRCHSEHAQPCAIQDQDCQSLAIKTCTLYSHVLSLSSKYLNFYLLFFNSFPPFFPPSFLLNSLSDCMLSYLLYAEVFFLE